VRSLAACDWAMSSWLGKKEPLAISSVGGGGGAVDERAIVKEDGLRKNRTMALWDVTPCCFVDAG